MSMLIGISMHWLDNCKWVCPHSLAVAPQIDIPVLFKVHCRVGRVDSIGISNRGSPNKPIKIFCMQSPVPSDVVLLFRAVMPCCRVSCGAKKHRAFVLCCAVMHLLSTVLLSHHAVPSCFVLSCCAVCFVP